MKLRKLLNEFAASMALTAEFYKDKKYNSKTGKDDDIFKVKYNGKTLPLYSFIKMAKKDGATSSMLAAIKKKSFEETGKDDPKGIINFIKNYFSQTNENPFDIMMKNGVLKVTRNGEELIGRRPVFDEVEIRKAKGEKNIKNMIKKRKEQNKKRASTSSDVEIKKLDNKNFVTKRKGK